MIFNDKEQHLRDNGWELRWGVWQKGSILYAEEEVEGMSLEQVKLLTMPVQKEIV